MYESLLKIPVPGDAGADVPLAAIEWPVLAARLAAARDLRLALQARPPVAGASFYPAAAAMLADRTDDGKREINPEGLVDGKQPWARTATAASEAHSGDREN